MSPIKDTGVPALAKTPVHSPTHPHAAGSSVRGRRMSGAVNMGVKLTALGVAGLVVIGGPGTAALAEGGGGGGVPGSGHGSSGAFDIYNMQYDEFNAGTTTPSQGYMQASTNYFIDTFTKYGPNGQNTDMGTGAQDQIRAACSIALDRAEARGGNKGTSRVVAMMWAGSKSSPWASNSSADKSLYDSQWATEVVAKDFPGIYQAGAKPFLPKYWPEALAGGGATPSAVCIALNQDEPPMAYTLTITTDAANTFPVAGGTSAVHDVLHANNGGSAIRENVTGNSILHWTSADGKTSKQVTKSMQIANQGDTRSPDFKPSDFGWDVWQGGSYWFDVQITKQGQMSGAVDTPDKDPRESWEAWMPKPEKDVVGSGEENGDHTYETINGFLAFPGQKAEYTFNVDLRIPAGVRDKINSLVVTDTFDPKFDPSKVSVEFTDSRSGSPRIVPKSAYKMVWDAAAHSWTATFTPEWIKANITDSTATGWLSGRFVGTIAKDAAPGSVVKNTIYQIVNGVKVKTGTPEIRIPTVDPNKEVLTTDLIDADGKGLMKGDTAVYRVTIDGTVKPSELAYKVHKLGISDDYMDEFLSVDPAAIRVLNKATGADVTSKFNIQVKDGVAYVYAKQVDSTGPTGDLIKGEPQPADLAAYDQAPIDPLTTPVIDQSLLGSFYEVMIPAKVIKDQDGKVLENQATQNIENTYKKTRIVSNPLRQINPKKDVTVEAGKGDSINGTEVKLDSSFNYRLQSSKIPANMAYGTSDWSIEDTFDRTHDRYTGTWAVYADTDVYDGETLIAKKNDLLQDQAGKGVAKDLFKVEWDEKAYTYRIAAQPAFIKLVNSRRDLEHQWSAYTQMIRIAPAESVVNVHDETYNKVVRKSNIVKTRTPEHPAIDLEKYTLREGLKAGDRDKADQALQLSKNDLQKGVKIGLRITNTGDVPLKNVKLTDATDAGKAGTVTDISCEVPGAGKVDPAKIGELVVGQSIDCTGLLQGMKAGDVHADTAKVVGESKFTGKKVSDTDPWNAKAPAPETPLAVTGGTGMAAFIGLGAALLGGAGALGMLGLRRKRQQPAPADTAAE